MLPRGRSPWNAISVDSWAALAAALVASAASVVLDVIFGANDDDTYTLRVIQRIARRSGEPVGTDVPGIFLEIDGLALPVLQRAMRDGSAPDDGSLVAEGTHALTEWETDLSSQTGASQAGSCSARTRTSPPSAGSRRRPARMMTCSTPADCAEIERRHATGSACSVDGGASRGNLPSRARPIT